MMSRRRRAGKLLLVVGLLSVIGTACRGDEDPESITRTLDVPEVTALTPSFGPVSGLDPESSTDSPSPLVVTVSGNDFREDETRFQLVPVPEDRLAALGLTRREAPDFSPVELPVVEFAGPRRASVEMPPSPLPGSGVGIVTVRAINPPGMTSEAGRSRETLFEYVPEGEVGGQAESGVR